MTLGESLIERERPFQLAEGITAAFRVIRLISGESLSFEVR